MTSMYAMTLMSIMPKKCAMTTRVRDSERGSDIYYCLVLKHSRTEGSSVMTTVIRDHNGGL